MDLCWYCGKPSDAASVDAVPMFRDVTVARVGFATDRVKWTGTNVDVPRCPRCARAHGLAERGGNALARYGALLGAVGGGVFVCMKRSDPLAYWYEVLFGAGAGLVAGFFVIGALGLIFSRIVVLGTRPRDTNEACPLIQARISEGWRVGKPPDLARLGDTD